MSRSTVYLITGGNRGIGQSIGLKLAQRENVTIITTSRKDTNTGIAAHPTSRHIELLLDESDPSISSDTLAERLRTNHSITHLDVVIANAGTSSGFKSILSTTPSDVLHDFTVNTVGVVKLFQATWPLLKTSETKKFVIVSSSVGSIASLGVESFPSTAYGMSKAAVNWFGKKLSVEFREKGLVVGVVHPGWVKTPMGQALADAVEFPEPPTEVWDSAMAVIEQIDNLTAETSGKFLNYDGKEIPW
ncbi:NAD(P)-binding Rossmann-fold containing protein [Podospora aff. communis PSN243]|uniref:NAD(P)-binding Rossmann-fold containing protein n=1 Tax=Podospora aff. communis PSN243 TaxID=3040156 RepID=A0AAV9G9R1_9PEZI|nr:NAD(P)-binding Rossmann-fold containing protein [Podospora aff. communis PSN243]